jgi:hypothetical protein
VAALSGVAAAAVYSPQRALPAQAIQQFLTDPTALLAQFPDGGAELIARVRDLAASDPATLSALIGLLTSANPGQATAIGTALGQVAVMAVKTDQAYAVQIQEAIVSAEERVGGVRGGTDIGSTQPKIGKAVTTQDQVEGVTEKGVAPISIGSQVYLDELVRTGVSGVAQLLFVDRTNLTVGPVTEIRLDKFVYDPNGGSGNVVLVATEGAFRFITGEMPSRNYAIRTPFATLGVRGTAFNVVLPLRAGAGPDKSCASEDIQLLKGEVIVTTISAKVVPLTTPNTKLTVDCHGATEGPTPTTEPIVNFAALGDPVTHFAPADAQFAFNAVTGNAAIGAAGVGTGGGGAGGGGTGGGGTGGIATGLNGVANGSAFLALNALNLKTAVATTPPPSILSLSFNSLTGTTPTAITQIVSPHAAP